MFLNITFLLPLKASPIAYVMSIVLTFYTWQPGATTPVYLKYTMDHSFPVEHLNIDFVLQVVSNYLFLLARNIRRYLQVNTVIANFIFPMQHAAQKWILHF